MAKQAWDVVVAYKLVWVRVIGYFAVPAWLMWRALTRDVTGVEWDMLSSFERFNIIGESIAAGVISFLAFIDQSMNKAGNDVEKKKRVDEAADRKADLANTGP